MDKLFYHLEPELLVGHFPPAETERHLDLHFVTQEINRVTDFYTEIVRTNRRAKLDFLDLVGVLMFPASLSFFACSYRNLP